MIMEYIIKFSFYINEGRSEYSINSTERNRDQVTFTRGERWGRGGKDEGEYSQ